GGLSRRGAVLRLDAPAAGRQRQRTAGVPGPRAEDGGDEVHRLVDQEGLPRRPQRTAGQGQRCRGDRLREGEPRCDRLRQHAASWWRAGAGQILTMGTTPHWHRRRLLAALPALMLPLGLSAAPASLYTLG